MSKDNFMVVENANFDRLLTLSDDHQFVRFSVPQFLVEGLSEPLRMTLVFDVDMVDEILEHLMELRCQMRGERIRIT